MNYDINQLIAGIIALHDSGGNPNQVMQTMFNGNSNVNQMRTQLQNMAQGKNMNEFIIQLAKQNGVSEQNIQGIMRIFGKK